jgi:uncharacterized Zn finger protein
LCKHVAAVLYGVGARLDSEPEMLFTLRDIDHLDLVSHAASAESLDRTLSAGAESALAGANLGEVFGIELDEGGTAAKSKAPAKRRPSTVAKKKQKPKSRGSKKSAALARH